MLVVSISLWLCYEMPDNYLLFHDIFAFYTRRWLNWTRKTRICNRVIYVPILIDVLQEVHNIFKKNQTMVSFGLRSMTLTLVVKVCVMRSRMTHALLNICAKYLKIPWCIIYYHKNTKPHSAWNIKTFTEERYQCATTASF